MSRCVILSLVLVFGSNAMAERQKATPQAQFVRAGVRAQSLLNRSLSSSQMRAVERAHLVGSGQPGKNGKPAEVGNYTLGQIRAKAVILKKAGFDAKERRLLMEEKIVGLYTFNVPHPSIFVRPNVSTAWRLAKEVGNNMGVEFTSIKLVNDGSIGDTYKVTIDAPNKAIGYMAAEAFRKKYRWKGF
jgi:hypothetical protein